MWAGPARALGYGRTEVSYVLGEVGVVVWERGTKGAVQPVLSATCGLS